MVAQKAIMQDKEIRNIRKKRNRITVQLSDTELEALEKFRSIVNQNLSDFVREAIRIRIELIIQSAR